MKILQLGKFYPIRGGVEKVMYDIAVGVSERDVQCDMLCAASKGQESGVIKLNNYGKVVCADSIVKLAATMISPQMLLNLRKTCNQYDVIHVHHPDPMACLALKTSGYKGKVVLHWHSDILKQKRLLRFYTPLQNWLIERADVIVGTSPVYVHESPFLADVQKKVTHIPIGVPVAAYENERVAAIKEEYKGKKIIFSLGRLVEYKGYLYLLEAAAQLPDDYVFLIGGIGPLKEELLDKIEELNLSDRVKLLGFLEDEEVPDYYVACDLFCLSSIQKTEAFAIVQIEAMSYGKPVVSTTIPGSGVSWVNKHRESGLCVPPENSTALAQAIGNILEDEELYKGLSTGAIERYSTLFTKEKMINSHLELYSSLLA